MRVGLTRFIRALGLGVMLFSPLVLTGCGSSNRTDAVANTFPFTGTYSGPFTFTGLSLDGSPIQFPDQTGTLSVTINPGGGLTGTGNDATFGQAVTSTGTVTRNGILNATFNVPGAGVETAITGAVAIASDGHLVATNTFTVTVGVTEKPVGTLAVDLTKQ